MTDALSAGSALAVLPRVAEYWLGVGDVPHQGAPTVAELEQQGYTRGPEHPFYPGSFIMVKKEAGQE